MPDLSALIERLEGAAGDAEKRPRREPRALDARSHGLDVGVVLNRGEIAVDRLRHKGFGVVT